MNLELFKTREEWLMRRGFSIGGSDVAAIVGLDKWQTPLQLYYEKTGRVKREQPGPTSPASMGHLVEPAIREAIIREGYTRKVPPGVASGETPIMMATRPDMPGCVATVDDLLTRDGINYVGEYKFTGAYIDKVDLPETWFRQVNWNMGITGLNYATLAWLSGGPFFDWVEVEFDPEIFDLDRKAVERFIECLETGEEPAPVNPADVVLKWPKPEARPSIVPQEELDPAFYAYWDAHESAKRYTDLKTQASDLLKMMAGPNDSVAAEDGVVYATFKESKTGRTVYVKSIENVLKQRS